MKYINDEELSKEEKKIQNSGEHEIIYIYIYNYNYNFIHVIN